jgi:hypothetical protein
LCKKILNFGFFILNTGFLFLINPLNAFAQNKECTADTCPPQIPVIDTLPGPAGNQPVSYASQYVQESLLPRIALIVVKLAITGSVIFLIVGAIQLLTAYGNQEKIDPAKKTLIFALIGLVISLLSYAIVQLIIYTGYRIENVK